jgi:hypothetical protein
MAHYDIGFMHVFLGFCHNKGGRWQSGEIFEFMQKQGRVFEKYKLTRGSAGMYVKAKSVWRAAPDMPNLRLSCKNSKKAGNALHCL